MLIDSYNRSFQYLRLSITEKCNFKCTYCLPNGYQSTNKNSFLDLNEIQNLAFTFKKMGIKKIRLTGGEPTLRSDIVDIVSVLKNEVGIEQVALTTNGFRLCHILNDLKQAGLDALNISLDSLNPSQFYKICGLDLGSVVKESILKSLDLGIEKVKVNTVLLKGLNDFEVIDFINWIQDKNISIRFIELMRTNQNAEYFKKHHLSNDYIKNVLLELGWAQITKQMSGSNLLGPAQEWRHTDYLGKIGMISPYSKDFCKSCNRLRISASGALRMCLFGEGDSDLRYLLQNKDQSEELMQKVCRELQLKPENHLLKNNNSGNISNLSMIGG